MAEVESILAKSVNMAENEAIMVKRVRNRPDLSRAGTDGNSIKTAGNRWKQLNSVHGYSR